MICLIEASCKSVVLSLLCLPLKWHPDNIINSLNRANWKKVNDLKAISAKFQTNNEKCLNKRLSAIYYSDFLFFFLKFLFLNKSFEQKNL